MRKIILLNVVLTAAGVCCVVAVYFCHFYYTLYQNTVTELESRINGFDMRLATLEGTQIEETHPGSFLGGDFHPRAITRRAHALLSFFSEAPPIIFSRPLMQRTAHLSARRFACRMDRPLIASTRFRWRASLGLWLMRGCHTLHRTGIWLRSSSFMFPARGEPTPCD